MCSTPSRADSLAASSARALRIVGPSSYWKRRHGYSRPREACQPTPGIDCMSRPITRRSARSMSGDVSVGPRHSGGARLRRWKRKRREAVVVSDRRSYETVDAGAAFVFTMASSSSRAGGELSPCGAPAIDGRLAASVHDDFFWAWSRRGSVLIPACSRMKVALRDDDTSFFTDPENSTLFITTLDRCRYALRSSARMGFADKAIPARTGRPPRLSARREPAIGSVGRDCGGVTIAHTVHARDFPTATSSRPASYRSCGLARPVLSRAVDRPSPRLSSRRTSCRAAWNGELGVTCRLVPVISAVVVL